MREFSYPGPCRDIDEIKAANEDTGGHFFDASTMRFFRSRVLEGVYGGRLFVTSEKSPFGPREYSIRAILDSGDVVTVPDGRRATARAAKVAAAAMVPDDCGPAVMHSWTCARFDADGPYIRRGRGPFQLRNTVLSMIPTPAGMTGDPIVTEHPDGTTVTTPGGSVVVAGLSAYGVAAAMGVGVAS